MVEERGVVASISNRREKWRGSLLLRFSSSLFLYSSICLMEIGGGDRRISIHDLFHTVKM